MGRIGVPVSLAVTYLFGLTKWMFLKCGLANSQDTMSDEELEAELFKKLAVKVD